MVRNSILLLTINPFNENDLLVNGVTKKILDQVESFKCIGLKTSYTGSIDGHLYLFSGNDKQHIARLIGRAYIDRRNLYNFITKMMNKKNVPQYVYVRHIGSDFAMIHMLKHLKSCGCKTIIEFPTFPYYGEKLRSVKGAVGLLLDLFCNRFLKKYISLTTNTNGYSCIFGTRSFCIENAVYLPRYRVHQKNKDKKGEIHLIAVSSMAKWHGYDRIIEGLRIYKQTCQNNQRVILHLVGDGPQLPYYKKLCEQYNLKDCVVFHGSMGGVELDELFDRCDIGLSSFGLYRIGLKQVSTLKVREYGARGIPFAYAYDEVSLKGDEEFACKLPNDSNPVKIQELVNFYNRLGKKDGLTFKIREFTQRNYSWEKQFIEMLEEVSTES